MEKLSENDIVLSEQLMNPIRSWNFLRDTILNGRAKYQYLNEGSVCLPELPG